MGFEGKSWLQVCFYSYRSVFIVTSRFFMVLGGFHVVYGSRSGFHYSRWIFIVINGPRLVKSELSAACAK